MPNLTTYAPDIYKALHGLLLVYKPPKLHSKELVDELRVRISDALNRYTPRPLSQRLMIAGDIDEEKQIQAIPNLADHPLVVGPRYTPFELQIGVINPLSSRTSGLTVLTIGNANKYFLKQFKYASLASVYHVSGRFGYTTDTCFSDGKIWDKHTYKHVRTGKMDTILAKMEASQVERLFDSSTVPMNSQQAYELAKNWPSRPPHMAKWPVIYRIRCIHLQLPDFKLEVTVANETETFLATLPNDIAAMLKSGAHTTAIRRIKLGPFNVEDSLTDQEWDLQSILNNLHIHNEKHKELHEYIRNQKVARPIDKSVVEKL